MFSTKQILVQTHCDIECPVLSIDFVLEDSLIDIFLIG